MALIFHIIDLIFNFTFSSSFRRVVSKFINNYLGIWHTSSTNFLFPDHMLSFLLLIVSKAVIVVIQTSSTRLTSTSSLASTFSSTMWVSIITLIFFCFSFIFRSCLVIIYFLLCFSSKSYKDPNTWSIVVYFTSFDSSIISITSSNFGSNEWSTFSIILMSSSFS